MAGNSGGPWGGGGSSGGGGNRGNNGGNNGGGGGRKPDEPQIPEIDELVKKGQEQLRVLMGGRGGSGGRGGGGSGGGGPMFTKGTVGLAVIAAAVLWGFASFYTVKPEEQSVELFLGEYSSTGQPGLNFAPWPLVTKEILPVTREQTEDIGVGGGRSSEAGLMLTGDENIVDIDFQVVWNISDPAKFLFNLRDARTTIRAVSESAMREIIAQSELAPILNRDRGSIASRLQELIQFTLDDYDSGINIIRVNFDKADPPASVIAAFRDVQAAEQERDRRQNEADAYANNALAEARGQAAELLERAEGYRARVVNEAQGEASRFSAVLTEYQKAPEVTRKRLYLETMEEVLGRVDKIILDEQSGDGQGVVPYLPLNELRRGGSN
ncbi:FtsH protease activity modulator HflK [Leisingera methylohalidivorans]|uniref:Protein HflK n=1 Tax=Leisingera methylohalidivorans DSM 14336 TaxID=999552 RepID=V9VRG1_9RHOB|nr:FtsH protease activity modulator HflK [Leisingera methylohalidivorans]AHD00264.1 membrane protein [Leisingera methylohalidivorans DSM 14336]